MTSSEWDSGSIVVATELIITDANGNTIVQIGTDPSVQIFNAGNLILIADTNGLRVLNSAGQLVGSIAQARVDLPLIGVVNRGIFSYDPTSTHVDTGLDQGELQFFLTNQNQPFFNGSVQITNPSSASVSSYLILQSATTNAAPDQAFVQVAGLSEDGTDKAKIILGKTVPADVEILVWGRMDYGVAGSTNPEPFHAATLQTGWSNTGTPYRNVKYKKTIDGKVALVGNTTFSGSDTAPSFVFFLPTGYRPDKDLLIPWATCPPSDGTNAQSIDILIQASDGLVAVTNLSGTFTSERVSFEGLSFYLSGN